MLPRGPSTPKIWQTYRYLSHPKEYVRKLVKEYGPATRFRMLQSNGMTVASPELAREVFATDPASFDTVPIIQQLFGARAVISTSGDDHKRQRKLLNPRFHGARMKAFFTTMQRIVEEHTKTWKEGQELVMGQVSTAITLDIILETVFGEHARKNRDRAHAAAENILSALSPSLLAFPELGRKFIPAWKRYDKARVAFDALCKEVIAERRASENLGDDILGMLLEARYEDGEPIEENELCDHLLTLLGAGHETTAVALSWSIHHLAKNPEIAEKVRKEVLSSDRSAEALVKLPYVNAVGTEALRLEPIVTDVARICRTDVKIGEWTVPAGEMVAVMIGFILGDAAIYDDPDTFRPERFLEKKPAANEFLPFGGGARRCLGAAFAESELSIALGTLASRFTFELTDPRPEEAVRRNLTMGPKRGVPVRIVGVS